MRFKFYSVNLLKRLFILVISFTMLSLTACAPKLGGHDYDVSSVGEISSTLKGVVIATKIVMLRPDNPHEPKVGTLAGAAGGAALGSLVGGGHKMPLAAAVVGGIAGGAAGYSIEQKLSEQKGIEYQIKLSNGSLITIAQGLEPTLSVGQKVLVIKSQRGRSRVVADNT